jgi:GTPase SAR1 family protein
MDYWLQKIKNNVDDENVELLLLGNKIDLINDRVVLEEDIREISKSHNNVPHFETSAKDSVNVDKAFR